MHCTNSISTTTQSCHTHHTHVSEFHSLSLFFYGNTIFIHWIFPLASIVPLFFIAFKLPSITQLFMFHIKSLVAQWAKFLPFLVWRSWFSLTVVQQRFLKRVGGNNWKWSVNKNNILTPSQLNEWLVEL